jgi:hypothetical protein
MLYVNEQHPTKIIVVVEDTDIEEKLSRCICGNKPNDNEWVDCNEHGIIITCNDCAEQQ